MNSIHQMPVDQDPSYLQALRANERIAKELVQNLNLKKAVRTSIKYLPKEGRNYSELICKAGQ